MAKRPEKHGSIPAAVPAEQAPPLLGQRLKDFRMKKGWSQQAMAVVLKTTQQEVSILEATNNISAVQLSRLRHYGLDVDLFLDPDAGTAEEGKDAVLRAFRKFESLYSGGIEEAFPTRAQGLQGLKRAIQLEDERIDVTGSSLKGLVMNREIMTGITDGLKRNPNLKLRILLTHPALAVLRAYVEGRETESIRNEITEAIDNYYEVYLKPLGTDRVEIRVALHPPTIFAMFLLGQRKALVNPYTLTIEAYSTTSLLIRDTGDENCMFRQLHLHHFEKAWDSRKHVGRRVAIELRELKLDPSKLLVEACDKVGVALKQLGNRTDVARGRRGGQTDTAGDGHG